MFFGNWTCLYSYSLSEYLVRVSDSASPWAHDGVEPWRVVDGIDEFVESLLLRFGQQPRLLVAPLLDVLGRHGGVEVGVIGRIPYVGGRVDLVSSRSILTLTKADTPLKSTDGSSR